MPMTLSEAQTQLDAWLAASLAVSRNQSYSIGDRNLNRANASEIQDQIKFWEGRVNMMTRRQRGRSKTFYVVNR
jgi:IS5 family transposase